MSVCSNCGAELDAGAKFCMECGTPVPQVKKCVQCGMELPLKAKFCFGCGAPQEGAPAGAGISMGDKNVVAGDVVGQKIAGDNVATKVMGNMTVNNNIIDETKKVSTCYICGKHLAGNEGYHCLKCNQYVCSDHFDRRQNCCQRCAVQTKTEFIVDYNGQGDATKISEALQYADDGATIIVRSGVYRDSFAVNKKVTIYGEDTGNGLPVIWNDTEDNHFVMQVNATAKISDLILQGAKTPFTVDFEYPERPEDKTAWEWWPRVVEINSTCTLNNIDICNSAGHGFAIAGENVEPQINGCKSFNNRRMGFWIIDNAKPVVTKCECHNNLIQGFSILQGASPKIKISKVYKNHFSGFLVMNQSKVHLDGCDIYENNADNILVDGESCSIEIFNSNIYGSTGGFNINVKQGKAVVKKSSIHNSTITGIIVDGADSSLVMENCKIWECKFGLAITKGASGDVNLCEIYSCKCSGIIVKEEKSKLTTDNCSIHDCKEDGFFVFNNGVGQIENSKIYKCDGNGVYIADAGDGSIIGCNIYDNHQKIKSRKSSFGEKFIDSRWEIYVTGENSSVNINRCKIGACYENETDYGSGCLIEEDARCVIENSKINSNRSCAAFCCKAAYFNIKNSHFDGIGDENSGFDVCEGVRIQKGSEGEIDDCYLTGISGGLFVANSKVKLNNGKINSRSANEGISIHAFEPNAAETDVKSKVHFTGVTIENGISTVGEFGDNEYAFLEEIRLKNCILLNEDISDYDRKKLAGKLVLINTSFEEK